MVKRISVISILAVGIILLALPQNSNAFGIGIFIPAYGSGSGTYTNTNTDYKTDYDLSYSGGLGIVLDTRVAKKGLFNYRLNLGYYNATHSFGGFDADGYKYYSMDHTFGFGIVKTRFLRLWLGPQLRIAYMNRGESYDYGTYNEYGLGFGLAPVLGANFNFGKVFTVALDLGYRFSTYAVTAESDTDYDYSTDDYTKSGQNFFINLSLIFRMGDYYEADNVDNAKEETPDDFYY